MSRRKSKAAKEAAKAEQLKREQAADEAFEELFRWLRGGEVRSYKSGNVTRGGWGNSHKRK